MADGGGVRPSSFTPTATNAPPLATSGQLTSSSASPSSLDGAFLLQLLQKPPQAPPPAPSPALPNNFPCYLDPAVAAVGPSLSFPPHDLRPATHFSEALLFPPSPFPSPPNLLPMGYSPQPLPDFPLFGPDSGTAMNRHFDPFDHQGLGFWTAGTRAGAHGPQRSDLSRNSSYPLGNSGVGAPIRASRKDLSSQAREQNNLKPPPGFGKTLAGARGLSDGFPEREHLAERLCRPSIGNHSSDGHGASLALQGSQAAALEHGKLSGNPRRSQQSGQWVATRERQQWNMKMGREVGNKNHMVHSGSKDNIVDRNLSQLRWDGLGDDHHTFEKRDSLDGSETPGCPSNQHSSGEKANERSEKDSDCDNVDGKITTVQRHRSLYQVTEVGAAASIRDNYSEENVLNGHLMGSLLHMTDGDVKSLEAHTSSSRGKDCRSDLYRGHHVSSQRIRFQRRIMQCRRDMDALTPSFLSIYESLVPAEEEKAKQKQLLVSLGKLVNKEWPSAQLHLYGSCANSFGVSNSDVDVCLAIDDNETSKSDILLKLADILQFGNLQNVQALTRARVPIVKLMDPDTGLSCDICINNLLAVVNTKLLRDYAKIDSRLQQLAFIVKHWARSRRVNETYQGTLSSYAYVIMCIHFLQLRRPAILPCLQEMEATYVATVDNTKCAYFDQVESLRGFGARNKESVAKLLWAFFHYWAYHHDYTNDVISIRTGGIISKQAKDWTRRIGNDRHLICIEDPFEISHDLGRVVDKYSIRILREEFERAANILQYDPNPSITLFDPYVPPPRDLGSSGQNQTELGSEF